MREGEEADSCQVSLRARKSRLESKKRLNTRRNLLSYVEKRYINAFKKFRRVMR